MEEKPEIEACFSRRSIVSMWVIPMWLGTHMNSIVTMESDLRSVIIRRDNEEFALIGEFVIDCSVETVSYTHLTLPTIYSV